ncbi:hypothetical protein Leryth_022929 [Lithospermum erythrorhizon]|uniref:Myb-like domain-containing protein n=1 Tax=Lithospermum erythrorhizon TaxID=34254 RepID=A0AAV3PHC6_LITER|nr:hypothetical protein Leryth_022929 [Lithospermum erythrorhizon]
MMTSHGGGGHVLRDYRKGNWTIEETMVLIEAKKMDDERRMKSERGKPTEQRWKWVEDYCWRKGCYRSQSQCNDKWDNLMRDFKKVREYERILAHEKNETEERRSYWRMEKNERKDKSLPPNMLSQIYDALVEVVERRGSSGSGGVEIRTMFLGQPPPLLPPALQHSTQSPTATVCGFPISLNSPHSQQESLPQPHPQQTQPTTTSTLPFPRPLPIVGHVESDTSEHTESPSKRRRRGEGTSGAAAAGGSSNEVGSAISRSATIIAEALLAREDKEEKRHKELVSLHERRLQIETSKAEINRQGINGMVDAINKLANSILALAANKNQVTPK